MDKHVNATLFDALVDDVCMHMLLTLHFKFMQRKILKENAPLSTARFEYVAERN
ncbi:MAG: hypothetical protein QXY88_03475 [Candidatus Bathyarchaeia archaeon]